MQNAAKPFLTKKIAEKMNSATKVSEITFLQVNVKYTTMTVFCLRLEKYLLRPG